VGGGGGGDLFTPWGPRPPLKRGGHGKTKNRSEDKMCTSPLAQKIFQNPNYPFFEEGEGDKVLNVSQPRGRKNRGENEKTGGAPCIFSKIWGGFSGGKNKKAYPTKTFWVNSSKPDKGGPLPRFTEGAHRATCGGPPGGGASWGEGSDC